MNEKRWGLVLAVLLVACAVPQIHHDQLIALNLGMEPSITVKKLGLPPQATSQVQIDEKEYLFHKYMLSNGIDSANYFLAFENGKLKYWGYIEDFRRHPDSRLNRAIDAALPSFATKPKAEKVSAQLTS